MSKTIPLDGPILIVAGPGTGKTYTLVQQIMRILSETDTPAETIMCLTFTETAADEMRTRLRQKIGIAADKIHISTYHGLGNELLRTHSDYLKTAPYENAVDDLTSHKILRACITQLGPKSPLKYADMFMGDVKKLMSECKRALITPNILTTHIHAVMSDTAALSKLTKECIPVLARIDKKSIPFFDQLLDASTKLELGEYGEAFQVSLAEAVEEAASSSKTNAITSWKNDWLEKNSDNQFILQGTHKNRRLLAFCTLFQLYTSTLEAENLFDYDDMILQSIELLKNNQDLRYSIQEKYLYVLLDEFQDTNPAQFELVKLLTDNPVHEGRPNILAVGDDDQAIYAFQGADHTNMHTFLETYRDVKVVPLSKNYRSGTDIIKASHELALTIEQRLSSSLIEPKHITAADAGKPAHIEQWLMQSDAEEASWIAHKITDLHAKKVPLNDIAVLAPKHKYLEDIVSYLHALNIPVKYEKRENILEDEVIQILELMCRSLLNLTTSAHQSDPYLVELFSHEMWGILPIDLWTLTTQARNSKTSLTTSLLDHESTKKYMSWLIELSLHQTQMTFEQIMDVLIGNSGSVSPLFRYYFADPLTNRFAALLNNLQLLRSKVKKYLPEEGVMNVAGFVDFVEAYRQSGLTIMNTNPHHEADDAVNIMTVYRSKGREFEYVFVPFLVDEVWGSKSRDKSSALSLPINLQYISYQGKTDDERRRLLYVALTRAASTLILTTHSNSVDGARRTPLGLLQLLDPQPQSVPKIQEVNLISPHWHDRHLEAFNASPSHELVQTQLARYKLSASDLNHYTDLIYGGPSSFLLYSLLRFPKASIPEALYGDAFHGTLEWIHRRLTDAGTPTTQAEAEAYFTQALQDKPFVPADLSRFRDRGLGELWDSVQATADLLTHDLVSEVNFSADNVVHDGVRLTGKIDRIHINQQTKTITVYDFKTGKSFRVWEHGEAKLHTYKKQLMFYKLLLESSLKYRNFKVDSSVLVFVERSEEGEFDRLELTIDSSEYQTFKQLVKRVWQHIQSNDVPDVSLYSQSLSGIKQFEKVLISEEL